MTSKQRLHAAALALYRAGRWELPKPCEISDEDQASLWEELRDALGLPPGTTTSPVTLPIAIYHHGDHKAYMSASREEQDAWNDYAQAAADDFNRNPSLDSYDSTSTYPGWNRDGRCTKWCPPLFFPEFIVLWKQGGKEPFRDFTIFTPRPR